MAQPRDELFRDALSALQAGQLHDAERRFKKILRREPGHVAALNLLSIALMQLKRFEEAEPYLRRALKEDPNSDATHSNYGLTLKALNRPSEAATCFSQAIAINPGLAETWNNRGTSYNDLGKHEEAIADFDKALAIDAGYADAHFNKGNACLALRRYDEAFAAYDRAFALKPALNYVEGHRLMAKLYIGDWTNLAAEAERLLASVRAGKPACAPFNLLAMPSSPAEQLLAARGYAAAQSSEPLWRGRPYRHDRIRVAYLSSDLRDHAVGHLVAGLFERHDHSRFEITALSTGPDDNSAVRSSIKQAAEHFVDVRDQNVRGLAELIRQREIDVLVDLNGFTEGGCHAVLAWRPAPIQVNYLGYAGTMGAGYYDYILADRTVIPQPELASFSEQVVWLPHSYLLGSRRSIAQRTPSRQECGLPDDAFVFACFNNTFKITPEMFSTWMQLLARVEGSVLWLSDSTPLTVAHRRREAQQRGIAPERLIFAPRLPDSADHMARHRQADLFLDTLPYNAHVTAVDALWSGLPVLTCLGRTFAGRVAASVLQAVELDELITHSLAEYEARAIGLAADRGKLASLKEKLAQNRDRCALFDVARTTRDIERAYLQMWDGYREGRPAVSFAIE